MSLNHFKKTRNARKALPMLSSEDANGLDANTVALALGLSIKHQGRHVELSNGIRGTNKRRMVWCQRDGTGIGDNIALAQHVLGLGFRPALELLLGQPTAIVVAPPAQTSHLRLPRSNEADKHAGRRYLASRGIADSAMDAAVCCGMLRYIPGAVLFVGYDGRRPMSATRRGYLPDDKTPKRDLAGSNKTFPPILPGSLDMVWIVEGGVDALALHTLSDDHRPTVIVSGGAGCRSWLEQEHIQILLKQAAAVTVACEREKDAETQVRTDALHRLQAECIQTYCPGVSLWQPPPGVKDVADLLLREGQHGTN